MKYGHNGDVEFLFINEIPSEAKQIYNTPMAYGEVTGHAHVITGDVTMFEHEGQIFAQVGERGARIQHVKEQAMTKEDWFTTEEVHKADHGSTYVEPGSKLKFGIFQQYNPYKKLMEQSRD